MLNPNPETVTDGSIWIHLAIASAVVLGLIALLGFFLRLFTRKGWLLGAMGGKSRRMTLIESLPIDARHRAVILACDDTEHLILVGGDHNLHITSHPRRPAPAMPPSDTAMPDETGTP